MKNPKSFDINHLTEISEAVKGATKMAEYLASIFGTEKDKVNCSFFFKVGMSRLLPCPMTTLEPIFKSPALTQR